MTAAAFHIPTLATESLRLRAPRLADFEHRAAFYASPRSVWEGGPCDRTRASRLYGSEVGQWPLMGYGPFSAEDRATGADAGEVGIYHAADYPRAEPGWFVVPGNARSIALALRLGGRIDPGLPGIGADDAGCVHDLRGLP